LLTGLEACVIPIPQTSAFPITAARAVFAHLSNSGQITQVKRPFSEPLKLRYAWGKSWGQIGILSMN